MEPFHLCFYQQWDIVKHLYNFGFYLLSFLRFLDKQKFGKYFVLGFFLYQNVEIEPILSNSILLAILFSLSIVIGLIGILWYEKLGFGLIRCLDLFFLGTFIFAVRQRFRFGFGLGPEKPEKPAVDVIPDETV